MYDFLREINEAGTTIILTTHYLEEAEACAVILRSSITVRSLPIPRSRICCVTPSRNVYSGFAPGLPETLLWTVLS